MTAWTTGPHRIPLDKDSWENVPTIVFKSFEKHQQNWSDVKKWTQLHEKKSKDLSEQLQQFEARSDESGAALRETKDQVLELTQSIEAMASQQRNEFRNFKVCIGSLLRVSDALLGNLCRAFDAEASAPVAAGPPEQSGDLEALEAFGNNLERQLTGLGDAFDRWARRRATEDERHAAHDSSISELQAATERTRERLLTWRELLKENSHVIDSLSARLDSTKEAIQELQAAQICRTDVEEAVGESTHRLEELHSQLERRVESIVLQLDAHVADTDNLFKEARRQTDAHINEHSSQVAQVLENNLHPINAYLNTMHVKADQVRAELDSLSSQVTKLVISTESIANQLESSDSQHGGRAAELGGDLSKLALLVAEQGEASQARHAALSDVLRGSAQDLGEQIGTLRATCGALDQALESVRQSDISGLAGELKMLESKVAKWVHAHPLPAKISEARLYSLETRLTEETDARLHLEHQLKPKAGNKPGVTPRIEGLPALPQLLPPPGDAGGPASARQASRKAYGTPR